MKGPRRSIPAPPTWHPREEWVWDGGRWLWIPSTKADVAKEFFEWPGSLSPRRCAEIIARGGEAAEECYRQLALRREVETTTAQIHQEQAFAPHQQDSSSTEESSSSYPFLVQVAAAISRKPEWHDDTLTILRTLDEDHYNRIMEQAEKVCLPAADYFGLPVEKVRRTLEALRAVEHETTTRATATPRLKWETDRLPDENPAHFAARAGYEHRGQIHEQDRRLSVKLSNWLRTHDWPEDVRYIPTKPEWNDRQVENLPQLRDDTVREVERLAAAARYRAAPRHHP
jgi:hypothetical protein